MYKSIYFLIFLFCLAFLTTEAKAQALNPELRAKRAQAKALNYNKTQDSSSQNIQTRTVPAKTKSTLDFLYSMPLVSNNIEKIYDKNRDGRLQPEEIKLMLNDVVSTVERSGDYRIASNLLKKFDKNHDGLINQDEIKEIQNLLK